MEVAGVRFVDPNCDVPEVCHWAVPNVDQDFSIRHYGPPSQGSCIRSASPGHATGQSLGSDTKKPAEAGKDQSMVGGDINDVPIL